MKPHLNTSAVYTRLDGRSLSAPPEFLVPLSDVTCDSGESAMLSCKVCGRPRPTVSWRGPNQNHLTNNERFSITYRWETHLSADLWVGAVL